MSLNGMPRFVLKIARAGEDAELLEAQTAMMAHVASRLPDVACPAPVRSTDGSHTVSVTETVDGGGESRASDGPHLVRLLTWVDGTPLADRPRRSRALRGLGRMMGRVSGALADFEHPALVRALPWDLAQGGETVRRHLSDIPDPDGRALVNEALQRLEDLWYPLLQHLPLQALHNDANDHNVVVRPGPEGDEVVGLIDFGDAVRSYRVSELAIAATYGLLGAAVPVDAVKEVATGFHAVRPLEDLELDVLLPLIELRLLVSVVMSAYQAKREPGNRYLTVSQEGAWVALRQFATMDRDRAGDQLRAALGKRVTRPTGIGRGNAEDISERRRQSLIPSLSLSYDEPLHIVRGVGSRLYDREGRAFLDCVNNVCHVGHSHPTVVRAIAEQAGRLNTNSRYYHEALVEYAENLADTLPDGLEVCAFVSSGSEANEMAIRMARAHTGRRDVVVLEGGYHGNTSTLVDVSSYKFDGAGGEGRPDWVHVAPTPDPYRGRYRAGVDAAAEGSVDVGESYARDVREALGRAAGRGGAAAFLAESIPSCGGQIVPPHGYLKKAYAAARSAGAVCIADEVQTGFGRVGDAFWSFELGGVVPDIVTMGKPIGNGHPIGAVVTTREIAASFANGMEYFATYGGNPVSCMAGLAVLEVLEVEGLQENAARVGRHLLSTLGALATETAAIGDVRGRGLFLGIEFVADPVERTPDASLAHRIVQTCRSLGVLLSTDGPDHNVIKIKPPLPFSVEDADQMVDAIRTALSRVVR